MSRIEENENEEIDEVIIKLKSYKRLMRGTECDKLYGKYFDKAITIIRKYQENAPTANRPHGKWDTEFINDGFVGCPFCRTAHDIEGDFHLNDLHYCVNCGAKLD